jgi:DNA repair ATPase RecN
MTLEILNGHAEVSDTLKAATKRSAGAKFWKVALQVNPFSYYNRHPKPHDGDRFQTEDEYNQAMIASARANGIEAIAITDHFRVDTMASLKAEAERVGILVFPGFEANSSDGVHLLCLFPPETSVHDLTMTIGACGVENMDVPSPQANEDCHSLLERVVKRGGICVAAHACSASGILRQLSGQSRIRAWTSDNLLAVALPGPREDAPQNCRGILQNTDVSHSRKRPVAVLNATDVSIPSDFADPACSCYVKMFEPTIEGLRQACLDWESRVRLNTEEEPTASAEISAIGWEGGFLADQSLRFNNGLNVLIGGRGAGKSALIESIRYAFGYPIRGADARTTHDAVVRNVLSNGTKVSVLVRDAPPSQKSYLVERVVPNEPTVRGEDGIIVQGLRPMELVPELEIFGQHELSELTRKPEELAKIIERFMDADTDHTDRQTDIERRLERSKVAIEQAATEIATLTQDTEALPRLQLKIGRMDELGLDEKLEGKLRFNRDHTGIREVATTIERIRGQIESIDCNVPMPTDPDRPLVEDAARIATETAQEVSEHLTRVIELLDQKATQIEAVDQAHQSKRAETDAQHAAVMQQLRSEGIDANEYVSLKESAERLSGSAVELQTKKDALAQLRGDRETIVNEWEDLKAAKLRALKEAARKAGRELSGAVRVQVERGASLGELHAVFDSNIEGQGVKIAIERLREVENLSLPRFASHVREGAAALVREYRFTEASAQKVAGGGDRLAMQIEAVELHPEAIVELNVSGGQGERWKRIEDLSAGQRATAVLLLLLGGSTSPLIVDQPEDDLDNRFITSTIVETIRREKRQRQFLFSTHNANIPVLGDAEQIIYLNPLVDGGTERTEVPESTTGSIDNPMVREKIGEVLEGGKEAFELRRKKYGY